MKQFVFIDNDLEKIALEDADTVKDNLEYIGEIPATYFQNMKIVSNFSHLDKKEALELLFDKNNIICTWSMYTVTLYNSLTQLFSFLTRAGQNYIEGITYIDCSGKILDALNKNIRLCEAPLNVLTAISKNNIITITKDFDKMVKLKVDFYAEEIVTTEDVDLIKLINN